MTTSADEAKGIFVECDVPRSLLILVDVSEVLEVSVTGGLNSKKYRVKCLVAMGTDKHK